MGKKLTLFIIPDDDSETKSYSLSSFFLKVLTIFPLFVLFVLFVLSIKYIPKVSEYENIKRKYNVLANERLKVLHLTENLEKLIHMDEFVRNSLGAELNFSGIPKVTDSVLMVIPESNLITLSDNIPSFLPAEGFISQRMGSEAFNIDIAHGGIDIVAKEGTPIRSATSGVVIFSGWTYEMGNLIILYHGDDYITFYGHNQKNLVSRLDVVKGGDVIGYVGNTGISSGPHLHFEIWKGEDSIDPLIYFPEYLKKDLTFKR